MPAISFLQHPSRILVKLISFQMKKSGQKFLNFPFLKPKPKSVNLAVIGWNLTYACPPAAYRPVRDRPVGADVCPSYTECRRMHRGRRKRCRTPPVGSWCGVWTVVSGLRGDISSELIWEREDTRRGEQRKDVCMAGQRTREHRAWGHEPALVTPLRTPFCTNTTDVWVACSKSVDLQ